MPRNRTFEAKKLKVSSVRKKLSIHHIFSIECFFKSKETYSQTRGLSNLEMKHVGELVIIGVLVKTARTSRVYTIQGRTYLIKHRLSHWLLLHSYYRIARVEELQLNNL